MENKIVSCPQCKDNYTYDIGYDNRECGNCLYTFKYISNNILNKCQHKNITAEFMGSGFLTTCNDCSETIY